MSGSAPAIAPTISDNGERIEKPRLLAEGDVVRFADWEFRLVTRKASTR